MSNKIFNEETGELNHDYIETLTKYINKMAYIFDSYKIRIENDELQIDIDELIESDKKFLLENNFYQKNNKLITKNKKIIEEFTDYNE